MSLPVINCRFSGVRRPDERNYVMNPEYEDGDTEEEEEEDVSWKHTYVVVIAIHAAVPFNVGGGSNSSGSGAIYRYDLDAFCSQVSKQMVAIVRSYVDGIHIDDHGRIWTAEYDGVVVRNSRGKVLGVFNAEAFLDVEIALIANFALAGNELIILAVDSIFIIELGQNVTTPGRFSSP
ncbi:hypothetical protein BJX63DRAFT_426851 [Aspergillus granulosus]|uniref:RNase H type-1 domain-containing protein n=1 Tax=Aspergillus granulosus TaxID=176169 RepID=A0ABR4I5J7_9EURO